MPKNIPTITNTPFAVGVTVQHRYDYARADRICVILSPGDCTLHTTREFRDCAVRCWGATGFDQFKPQHQGWLKPKNRGNPQVSAFCCKHVHDGMHSATTDRKQQQNKMCNPCCCSLLARQGDVRTLAGTGEVGRQDGPRDQATFNNPQGLVVDDDRAVYVADTDNHLIRRLDPTTGDVSTVAGTTQGFADGLASEAKFSHPTGIALFHDWTGQYSSAGETILVVADTNNHKIRVVVLGDDDTPTYVWTIAGGGEAGGDRGYRDGRGSLALLDTPHGIAVTHTGVIFVADTLNFVVRSLRPGSSPSHLPSDVPVNEYEVTTIAGNSTPAPNELPGCPDPCIEGVSGSRDGPLDWAQFYYPYDVAIGPNNTVIVADGDRIRRINAFRDVPSTVQGVTSVNRVVTMAGTLLEGDEDGIGHEARFNKPRGVWMGAEGRVYVADTVGCRIRRIASAVQVARPIECRNRMVDIVRPSGCQMYDPPVGGIDLKATPVTSNYYYNYNETFLMSEGDGIYEEGRKVQPCVGSPEWDIGVQSSEETLGPYEGTGWVVQDKKQDLGDQTVIRYYCPPGCQVLAQAEEANGRSSGVFGTGYYTDESLVCAAAVHAGVIDDGGGIIGVRLRRNWGSRAGADSVGHGRTLPGSVLNGITSDGVPDGWRRTFTIHEYPEATVEVATIAGHPNGPLENNCGHRDGRPPQDMMFSRPTAIATFVNATLSDTEFLYVADSHNNVIRTVTAVCSKVCENGGECISEEVCACPPGWDGDDCAIPICTDCITLPYVVDTCTAGVIIAAAVVSPCPTLLSCSQGPHLHCTRGVHLQAWLHGL